MKTNKYDGNDLVDFLLREPMEMREFIEAHERVNFFVQFLTKFRAYFY
jgi:allophanate hydrolase subunit 1